MKHAFLLLALIFTFLSSCEFARIGDISPRTETSQIIESEFNQQLNLDCFFSNSCLPWGSSNDLVTFRSDSTDNLLTELVREHLLLPENFVFTHHVAFNHGVPVWEASIEIKNIDSDSADVAYLPVVDPSSLNVTAIILAYHNSSNPVPIKYHIIDRDNIDNYPGRQELDNIGMPISKEANILSFIYFEQTILGEVDCALLEEAVNLIPEFIISEAGRDEGNLVAEIETRNQICYAVLTTVYTEWFQYNPITGTYISLGTTYSYSYVEDICIDVSTTGVEIIPTGGGGGFGGSGGTSSGPNPWIPGGEGIEAICVPEQLHEIQDAYYVNYTNFSHVFHNTHSGQILVPTWANLCIQVPKYNGNGIARHLLQTAIENGISGTVSALRFQSFTTMPELKFIFRRELLISLNSLMPGSSIDASGAGCPGVPTTPTNWGC